MMVLARGVRLLSGPSLGARLFRGGAVLRLGRSMMSVGGSLGLGARLLRCRCVRLLGRSFGGLGLGGCLRWCSLINTVLLIELVLCFLQHLNERGSEVLGNELGNGRNLRDHGGNEGVGADVDIYGLLADESTIVAILNYVLLGLEISEQSLTLGLHSLDGVLKAESVTQCQLGLSIDSKLPFLQCLNDCGCSILNWFSIGGKSLDLSIEFFKPLANFGHDISDGIDIAFNHSSSRVDDTGRNAGSQTGNSNELHVGLKIRAKCPVQITK